jgi:protein TonB
VRPDDLPECPLPDLPPQSPGQARGGEGREGVWFEIDPGTTAYPEAVRAEPVLAADPFPSEFDEPERLDPGRAQAEPEEPAPPRRRPALAIGMLGSLGLHLLPLLVLLHWNSAPAEMAAPIPVQLVIEEPPAPSPPPASEIKPPPPGRIASEDIGEMAAPPPEAAATPPPEETRIAAVAPPPPKPVPPPKPAAASPAWHRLDAVPQEARREARVPGPAATRDEYLAYLVALTRRHFDMLPMSMVAGRHGETVLAILVLGDGTIARIAIEHSSGYPDIDARIERMVSAVGRFPPLPQWYQGPNIELNLRLRFPEALER